MNLITAKTLDQIKLKGVRFEWEKHDGSVRTVKITDEAGNVAILSRANSYSEAISVLIPEPPKMEDRWVLNGTFASVAINRAFETEREAERAKAEFPHGAELEITKQSVAVNGDGAVIDPPNDIPF